jgi:hypothetical protein
MASKLQTVFFKILAKIFRADQYQPHRTAARQAKLHNTVFTHTDSLTAIYFCFKTGQNIFIFSMAMNFLYTKICQSKFTSHNLKSLMEVSQIYPCLQVNVSAILVQ